MHRTSQTSVRFNRPRDGSASHLRIRHGDGCAKPVMELAETFIASPALLETISVDYGPTEAEKLRDSNKRRICYASARGAARLHGELQERHRHLPQRGVEAETLHEAAGLGLARLKKDGWIEGLTWNPARGQQRSETNNDREGIKRCHLTYRTIYVAIRRRRLAAFQAAAE